MEAGTIVIAGGGIGGLVLACALRRAGRAVQVYERAPELKPVGAGITVQPNAMLALRALGLDEAVARAGAAATHTALLEPSGKVLSELPFPDLTRELGAPAICIHRGRLQQVFLDALGEGVVHTGQAVRGFREERDSVVAELEGGGEARGVLLVGADGLRSRVRAQLLGEGELRYAGYTSWRGVCSRSDLVPEGSVTETWGPGLRFGIVPIGFGEVYWFCASNAPANGRDEDDPRAALLARFGSWHEPIAELIRSTDPARILRTDISDRPPVTRWSRGRVVLLGDAAHPMTPNLGQGGCQAIEDAWVLARAIETQKQEDVATTYERARVERANGFVRTAWTLGRVAQWENPAACWLRNMAVRATPGSTAARQLRSAWTLPRMN